MLAVSVAGGDGQDQIALQLLLNVIDFDLSLPQAVAAPRFGTSHHIGSFRQPPPLLGSLLIDPAIGDQAIQELKRRGHKVTLWDRVPWLPVLLRIDPHTGVLDAAGDPRARRHAAGY